ncbi:ubiquitin carboxyl-terminal hydrolase 36-like [Bradysia coprophila]|uniref:ubiquitin carboxyl-terminal hydrolase 36-like n=1 Tax=Bradysia coprophila TaxID=38358 RepID=UPI00187D994A|nr:ubiquitin carboxyl-terminal hydrolase 36-like [Bradysia coprophila]
MNLYVNIKSNKVACSPYTLYDCLKKTNQRLSDLLNGDHQDAHEFLIVLNQELERPPHSARWFSNNFSMKLATSIKCDSCGKVHESTSPVTDLALHLEGNQSIQAAVDSYFDYDDVDFLCEECRTYDTVKKKHLILSAPPCICLQLRRFSEQGTKITDAIEISGISLKKHFLKTQTSEWNYELVAIVNHFGQSRNVGHYNTIVLTSNGEYYEFDDRSVRKVSSNIVSGENAYLLFYKQVEVPRNNSVEGFCTSNDNFSDDRCPSTESRSSIDVNDHSVTNR